MQTEEDKLRPAVFLDRDGTINLEKDYLYKIEDFEFIPGAQTAIKTLKDAGFLVIVVTNQSGVARGYYTMADVDKLHHHLQTELGKVGTSVDAFYSCPHHPTEGTGVYRIDCSCRKPSPGMLIKAAEDWQVDLERSYIIGDKMADVLAGESVGCTPMLVKTGYGSQEFIKSQNKSLMVFDNIADAAACILRDTSQK